MKHGAVIFAFFFCLASTLSAQEFQFRPGQSLAQVRDEIRAWHSQNPGQTAVVKIAPGEYFFAEPVEFTSDDSNTVYEAADPTQPPVFTRGIEITGWKAAPNGWFVTKILDVADGNFWFESLFVGGQRAQLARTPNADVPGGDRYLYIQEVSEENPKTQFSPREPDRAIFAEIAQMPNPRDVKILLYHSWETSFHRVESVDTAKNLVTLTGPACWDICWWGKNQRYHVEGIESALDEPGEFLLKRDGTCIYIPREGETPENVRFLAPMGPKPFEESGFLKFNGTQDSRVKNIKFRNITFTCDVWNLPEKGLSVGQSAISSPASILANYADGLEFTGCKVTHIGGYAFHFHVGCTNCRVEKTLMEDLGAGGVRIGPGHGTDLAPENLSSGNLVQNCIVRHYGQIDLGGIGVWIGHAPKNSVLHNDISDGYYTGVSLGWIWGYSKSVAVENHIEFNHIHHIGQGVLSDMGGVYSLGISPGTTVSNNVIHDVYSYNRYGRGGMGLYTDEGSSDILMENNLVYQTHTGNFHQHYGENNLLRNNIFAFSLENQLQRSRPEEHTSFTLEQNIIVYDSSAGQTLLHGQWKNPYSNEDRNIYWNYGDDHAIDFQELSFEEWQKLGKDQHSVIADPCFQDAKNFDFRFTDASKPVLEKIGFKPFDFTQAGVLKDEPAWVKEAQNWVWPEVVFAPDGPALPPFALMDDFETPRRNLVRQTSPHGNPGSLKILEENGNHFLRIYDTPDQQYEFDPFWQYNTNYTDPGMVYVSFDVRVAEGADLMAEVRDEGSQYRIAATLRVKPDGVYFHDETFKVPATDWVHVELLVPNLPADGEPYTVKITPKGGETRTFVRPIRNPAWKEFDCLVFAALGHNTTTIDLDNVRIELKKQAAQ